MTINTAREPGRKKPPKSTSAHYSPKSEAGWVMNLSVSRMEGQVNCDTSAPAREQRAKNCQFRDSSRPASGCVPRVCFPSISCFLALSLKRSQHILCAQGYGAPYMHTVGLQTRVLKSDFLPQIPPPPNTCYLGCLGEISKSLCASLSFLVCSCDTK